MTTPPAGRLGLPARDACPALAGEAFLTYVETGR